ncbi:translation initiation factor eIF-2B subunit delta isoform X1 [Bombyx mori]|uniref:Translation initiation factor eIF2B subunit delta n=2 Tax=Bombyx mori TaxID=7091 RepID=A0A8R2QU49_BOMMO|nr:translation initiation factor eIF-2B subunit delta isoform X1 [Bombyx mori]
MVDAENYLVQPEKPFTATQRRRIRRNRLRFAKTDCVDILCTINKIQNKTKNNPEQGHIAVIENNKQEYKVEDALRSVVIKDFDESILQKMSSNEIPPKSRDEIKAARQAKKAAKLKVNNKTTENPQLTKEIENLNENNINSKPKVESTDEVDKSVVINPNAVDISTSREQIKADRAAKKSAKQLKKKGAADGESNVQSSVKKELKEDDSVKQNEDMTVKDVVETLKNIVSVAKEVNEITTKVSALDLGGKKQEETGKSKAELRAERRAKQEAQRAAKQAAEKKVVKPKLEAPTVNVDVPKKEEKVIKSKTLEKSKTKLQLAQRFNWFQHLYTEFDKNPLKKIPINSNLHPAIVKLGVQLSSRVVKGSNARCIALLDALNKMVRDYVLPAKTEFSRGLESHLASSLEFLWTTREPCASQINAVKFFRHHLAQLPNNVDEFDAKKTLQEEIDRYIREQIEMAGEAISIAVRNKISNGDTILTYGCSSLIEQILCEAWEAGLQFRTLVVGSRVSPDAAEMLRRLCARGLPCTYVDFTAVNYVMKTVSKVVLGAGALLANGAVVSAAGTAGVALAARARNRPVLVACHTHKFIDSLYTDAFMHNQIGDPDDLLEKSDDNSPLKDWRSNLNLTPLNLTYDVTPPCLITAVVTELAILPCTSAPVVLRFKLSEYGV